MPAVASVEEAKELRALVRMGRLFDVQTWLEAGKPFRTDRPSFIQSEPCVVAVKTGFFSMVECLDVLQLCSRAEGRVDDRKFSSSQRTDRE